MQFSLIYYIQNPLKFQTIVSILEKIDDVIRAPPVWETKFWEQSPENRFPLCMYVLLSNL